MAASRFQLRRKWRQMLRNQLAIPPVSSVLALTLICPERNRTLGYLLLLTFLVSLFAALPPKLGKFRSHLDSLSERRNRLFDPIETIFSFVWLRNFAESR